MSVSAEQVASTSGDIWRRADWRFLLPDPAPSRAVCFDGGPLREAVRAIAGTVLEVPGDGHVECDLAVAADPDAAMLRAAWQALAPGGVCYTEWRHFRRRAPRAVRRALTAAGFTDIRCYCPRPDPAREPASVWLPLEAPAALDHFIGESTHVPRGLPWMRRLLRRLRWSLTRWVGSIVPAPVSAIARKPACTAPASPPATVDAGVLTEMIRSRWSPWDGADPLRRMSWLLRVGGPRRWNKVVLLGFAEPDGDARVAVKIARIPESAAALANEAATLDALRARPRPLRGVPEVLFFDRYADAWALGETAIRGRRLDTVITPDGFPPIACKATAWLVDLARGGEPSPSRTARDDVVTAIVDTFEASFASAFDASLFRDTRHLMAGLASLPVVCEHRDFNQFNLVITAKGDLGVLDWESSTLEGLPALDLIYFLACVPVLSLEAVSDPEGVRRAFRATLDDSTPTGAMTRECLTRYATAIGLDPAHLPALRVLTWMLHSCSEYRWLRFEGGRAPEPDLLRAALFATLWHEEIRTVRGGRA